ncbi:hypothetical protein DEO72_LG5g1334 [Vigna unguiculata]|uniref:Uncharacterized protein n=1 Tax=Vigna unguiculata TaxID=3917 RepID=A0A4D6LWK7_VIGUN|nr:hypothetical protein DEO72_LG5g1334 [Vigna unguiculata]
MMQKDGNGSGRTQIMFICNPTPNKKFTRYPRFVPRVAVLVVVPSRFLLTLFQFCCYEYGLCAWCDEMFDLRRTPTLSDSTPRSSEEVSPKRECVTIPLFLFASPHLGEGSLPEQETLSPKRDSSA